MSKKELQVFTSDEFGQVRTVMRDGEPWFVATDLCRALEISNNRDAISRLDEDEKGDVGLTDTIGRETVMNIVNESGLYSLIMGSRKPEARKFKRWITHDVLPSIRKYGVYASSGIFSNPGTMAALVQALQHEQERGERLQRRLNWLSSPAAQKLREEERALKADEPDDMPERSARLFVDVLGEMIASGEARVAAVEDREADGDDLIGFKDDQYLYVIPQRTYEHVARRCREDGESFPVSRVMLNKSLRYMGMIEPDGRTGTATKPKWVAGRPKRLLWILRDKMK